MHTPNRLPLKRSSFLAPDPRTPETPDSRAGGATVEVEAQVAIGREAATSTTSATTGATGGAGGAATVVEGVIAMAAAVAGGETPYGVLRRCC